MAETTAAEHGLLGTSIVVALDRIDLDVLADELALAAVTLAELAAAPHATDDLAQRARRQEHLQRTEVTFDRIVFDAACARACVRAVAQTLAGGRKARGRRASSERCRRYADVMPMPKRSSVDDFFAQLSDVQRPHLEALRQLCRDADSEAREELKWNLPVYVRGEKTNLWMLQNFKNHCSLRFPPPFFATQKAAVEAAGYEAGEGFIKLPYDRELPTDLLKALMRARVAEYAATGSGWSDR